MLPFKSLRYFLLFAHVCWFQHFHAQEDAWKKEFNAFQLKNKAEFDDFRKQINAEYAQKLKANWEEFSLLKPIPKPKIPEPPVAPIKDPVISNEPTKNPVLLDVPAPKPASDPVVVPKTDPATDLPPLPENIPLPTGIPTQQLNFFQLSLNFPVDPGVRVACKQVSETAISTYWSQMSSSNYSVLLAALEQLKSSHHFNDWTMYLVVEDLAKAIHTDLNAQKAFQFFFLNQLGYDVKIASSGGYHLLVNFMNTVYNYSYSNFDNKRYYFMSDLGLERIHTMPANFSKVARPIDLNQRQVPELGGSSTARTLYLKDQRQQITLAYRQSALNYYNRIPPSDFSIFFNASLTSEVATRLTSELKPLLSGLSEVEAVQLLLSFVQQSFDYQTDQQQFGQEKYFFPEEILGYPFSDCEDRSVFFAYLVKHLVGLEVIGLHYPGHVATAVKFNAPIHGDAVRVNGVHYIVCDPTYIGAAVGEAMPEFRYTSPETIRIEKE